jgi:hypothetical protein
MEYNTGGEDERHLSIVFGSINGCKRATGCYSIISIPERLRAIYPPEKEALGVVALEIESE